MRKTALERGGLALALLLLARLASAQEVGGAPSNLQVLPELRVRHEVGQSNAPAIGSTAAPQDWLTRFRLGFAWQSRNGLRFFLQPQQRISETVHGPAWKVQEVVELYQGYVEQKKGGWTVRMGRQVLAFGIHRLLDDDNWNNISRSFDALRIGYKGKGGTSDLFVGRVAVADGKPIRPFLTGVYSTLPVGPSSTTDLYLLYVHDHESGNNFGLWTVGTRPVVPFLRRAEASVESAFQFGHNGAKSVTAWAYGAVLSYRFPGRAGVKATLERDFASGGDPTNPYHTNTFDPLFGSSHSFFGSLIYMNWRNTRQWRITVSAAPFKRWTCTLDTHFLSLADARDYWYAGGPVKGTNGVPLRSPTGAAGRDIGKEVDLIASYALSGGLGLELGYSHFFPGHFVRAMDPAHAHEGNWFYLQPTWRF